MKNLIRNGDFRAGEAEAGIPTINSAENVGSGDLSSGWVYSYNVDDSLTGSGTIAVLPLGYLRVQGLVPELPDDLEAHSAVYFSTTGGDGLLLDVLTADIHFKQTIDNAWLALSEKSVNFGLWFYSRVGGVVKLDVIGTSSHDDIADTDTVLYTEIVPLVAGWNRIARSTVLAELDQTNLTGNAVVVKLTIQKDSTVLFDTVGGLDGELANAAATAFYFGEGITKFDPTEEVYTAQIVAQAAASAVTPSLADVLGEDNDADGEKITNLDDPSTDQDAATKKYVDDTVAAVTAGGVTATITVLDFTIPGAYYTVVIENGIITSVNLTTP